MPPSQQRYFVKYTFFKLQPEWRRLPGDQRACGAQEFQEAVDAFSDEMQVRSYNLQGIRGDADFMLWQIAPSLEALQSLGVRLAGTGLGRYLDIPYSYLAMTRPSPYVAGHQHPGQEGASSIPRPKGSTYLFVYPFVKTRAWYALPAEERQRMMNQHFVIGHKYPSVKINTAYSFGLDDQEFMVSFETEKPGDFLDLVADLRETEASSYTLRDTPIFTCIRMDLPDILKGLAGGE